MRFLENIIHLNSQLYKKHYIFFHKGHPLNAIWWLWLEIGDKGNPQRRS